MTPRAELTQKTWPVKRKPQLDVCFGGVGGVKRKGEQALTMKWITGQHKQRKEAILLSAWLEQGYLARSISKLILP